MDDFTLENDTWRVRLAHDDDPSEPYFDGGFPMVRIEHGGETAEQVTSITSYVLPDNIVRAAADFSLSTFERYLRIFHGTTTVETDRFHEFRAPMYITFDTAHWREAMEIPPEQKLAAEMDEYRAYLEGDCYGIITERRDLSITVEHINRAARFCGDESPHRYVMSKAHELAIADGSFTWNETHSIWGYYGDTYAKQAAQEAFNDLPTSD